MECYKCDVCAKLFSGLVCFQQHEASEKHKKKVRLMNGVSFEMPTSVNSDQFHCPVCMVSISGWDNYQKHVNSLDHALSVQKKSGDLLSQSLSSTFELKTEQKQVRESAVSLTSPIKVVASFAECKPCQKQFSGPEPYQQHLASAGHKKKCGSPNRIMQSNGTEFSIENEKMNNSLCDSQSSAYEGDFKTMFDQSASNMSESNTEQNQLTESSVLLTNPIKVVAPFAECKPCQKQFSGPEPYQQHLASVGHKKKCGSLNEFMQTNETGFSLGNEKIDPNKIMLQPFAKCDICKMEFNGAVLYQMHLVSDCHKKQVADHLLNNSFVESQSAFKCDVCVLKFTGPVPYQQHLASIGHEKKINAAELSKLTTTGSLPPDSTFKDNYLSLGQSSMKDVRKWYCDTCDKQCSGPIPYNTHILSRDHSKNLRILEIQKNLNKMKESSSFAHFGSDQIDSSLSSQVTSTADLPSDFKSKSVEYKINDLNIDVKSEDAKILSNKFQINSNDLIALPNFNIIPPEKLDVTVFEPDDEILFSNPKKCLKGFLTEINEVKEVQ